MKKQVKKLALAKETVRSLEALREVRGGSAYIPYTDGYWSCRVCYPDDSIDFSACAC